MPINLVDDKFSVTRGFGIPNEGDIQAVGPENPLIGLEGALAWQTAWTSAIALAWADPAMKEALIRDPYTFFKVYANYELPSGLALKVREMEKEDSAGQKSGWDPTTGMWYLQKTELTMFIPTAPPVEQQAVALAAYVATARAYPFTGC